MDNTVVKINCGGEMVYAMRKILAESDSYFSAFVSGRFEVTRDSDGNMFLDISAERFKVIYNYLKYGIMPELNRALEMFKIAQFYSVTSLVRDLETLQPVCGEQVRKAFFEKIALVENVDKIIDLAKECALSRHGTKIVIVRFCMQRNNLTGDFTEQYKKHHCDTAVTFGSWEGLPTPIQLADIIGGELQKRGYLGALPVSQGYCNDRLNLPARGSGCTWVRCRRQIFTIQITLW